MCCTVDYKTLSSVELRVSKMKMFRCKGSSTSTSTTYARGSPCYAGSWLEKTGKRSRENDHRWQVCMKPFLGFDWLVEYHYLQVEKAIRFRRHKN